MFLSVGTGISGFLSSFSLGVRPGLVLRHGTLHSSRVVEGVSGLLSSSGRDFGLFQEDRQGRQASRPVVRVYSVFLSSETGMSGDFLCRIKCAKYRFDLQDGTWDFP